MFFIFNGRWPKWISFWALMETFFYL